MRSGKVNVAFNSIPVKIKEDSVTLDVGGQLQELPNDYVWIFAGGTPPYDFLKKIGVQFGMRDLTSEAGRERNTAQNQLAQAAR
jgi:thioredoxin reductase